MPDLSVKISELTEASSATDSDIMIIEGAETQKIKWSTINSTLKIGDVNTLKTNNKSNLVAAINELNDNLFSDIKLTGITTTNQWTGPYGLPKTKKIFEVVVMNGSGQPVAIQTLSYVAGMTGTASMPYQIYHASTIVAQLYVTSDNSLYVFVYPTYSVRIYT